MFIARNLVRLPVAALPCFAVAEKPPGLCQNIGIPPPFAERQQELDQGYEMHLKRQRILDQAYPHLLAGSPNLQERAQTATIAFIFKEGAPFADEEPIPTSDRTMAEHHLLRCLRSRFSITRLEAEPDHDVTDRDFSSRAVMEDLEKLRSTAGHRLLTLTRPLNVSQLRNDMLIAIHEYITGKRTAKYFRTKTSRGGIRILRRTDVDIDYKADFPNTKDMLVSPDFVEFIFNRPLDLKGLKELFESHEMVHYEIHNIPESEEGFRVTLNGKDVVSVMRYQVLIPYRGMLTDAIHLERSINIATRVIEAIYQDELFSAFNQVVLMEELKPFIYALMGIQPSADFERVGQFISTNLNRLSDRKNPVFHETQRSLKTRIAYREKGVPEEKLPPQSYLLLSKACVYPEHVRYILFEDGKERSVIIGFDMCLEKGALERLLLNSEQHVTMEEAVSEGGWVQQGGRRGGRYTRKRAEYRIYRSIGEERKLLMVFGLRSVKIPLSKENEEFIAMMKFLDQMFNKGTFVTATMEEGKLQPGLTEVERQMHETKKTLKTYFNLFIHDYLVRQQVEAMQSGGRLASVPTALEWIVASLNEAKKSTPEGRLLYILKKIHSLIPSENLARYGPRAATHYQDLTGIIQAMEGTVVKPAT